MRIAESDHKYNSYDTYREHGDVDIDVHMDLGDTNDWMDRGDPAEEGPWEPLLWADALFIVWRALGSCTVLYSTYTLVQLSFDF